LYPSRHPLTRPIEPRNAAVFAELTTPLGREVELNRRTPRGFYSTAGFDSNFVVGRRGRVTSFLVGHSGTFWDIRRVPRPRLGPGNIFFWCDILRHFATSGRFQELGRSGPDDQIFWRVPERKTRCRIFRGSAGYVLTQAPEDWLGDALPAEAIKALHEWSAQFGVGVQPVLRPGSVPPRRPPPTPAG
jgi:hypothetical protein